MTRGEAIEILSDMRCECNLFGDEEEATRYHVLSWAINAMNTEPKHGRWIESWGGKWHSCSVCGGIPPFNFKGEDMPTNYCPHCGAKMDEVEE